MPEKMIDTKVTSRRTLTAINVVALETASPPGSLAILRHDQNGVRPSLFRRLEDARRTTETFAGVMQSMMKEADLAPNDLHVVATTTGPGSFTGLRIGVTAAKVLAHTVSASVVGVNTLELLAVQAFRQLPPDSEVEAVLDAQRGELFAARFKKNVDQAIGMTELLSTKIIDADEWIASRARSATLVGTGLKKILDKLPADAQIADESLWVPDAKTLAEIALKRAQDGNVSEPMGLVPQYYRKSAAEEKADKEKVEKA